MHIRLTSIATAILLSNTALAQSTEETDDIEKLVITGQYLSSHKSNSIKTPTPILDVPQSLSIFSAEEITQRGFVSVGQIVDYTPGLNTSQGEGHRDAVVFRGQRSTADFFIDGNRDDVQYFRSLYNLEQVEVLRGPNALLFGRGGTGGVINRVTKKAQIGEQFTGYQAALNTFGGYRAQIDTNIASTETAAFRINAMVEHLENHRDFFDGDRYGLNPTARFIVGSDTTIDLSYEYINHERFIDRGVVTSAGIGADEDALQRPVERLDRVTFGDPDNNFNDVEAHVFRAAVQHHFSDHTKGNFSAFYGNYDKVYSNFFATDFDEAANTVDLDGYIDSTDRDNFILSGNIVSEFQTGNIGHTFLVGAEYIDTDSDQNRINSLFDTSQDDVETFTVSRPLDFRNFVGVNSQGQVTTNGFFAGVPEQLNDDTRVSVEVSSFFLQDEIALSEHLDLVLGGRFDRFDIEVLNVPADDFRTRTDNEFSPRAGLVYKPLENISIYASYSQSFLPRSGEQFTDINGDDDQLDPDEFRNREVGVKWDFAEGLSLTTAIFENRQSSPQVADNDVSTLDIIDQEINGFEIEVSGRVIDGWSITANYSFLNGEIVEDTGPTGRTPREVPQNTASVWNSIQVNEKFGLGIGATYQDESFIDNGNRGTLPSYVRVDASAHYNVSDSLRVQLNIENLTDTTYFPNSHALQQVTVGAPINATLSFIGTF